MSFRSSSSGSSLSSTWLLHHCGWCLVLFHLVPCPFLLPPHCAHQCGPCLAGVVVVVAPCPFHHLLVISTSSWHPPLPPTLLKSSSKHYKSLLFRILSGWQSLNTSTVEPKCCLFLFWAPPISAWAIVWAQWGIWQAYFCILSLPVFLYFSSPPTGPQWDLGAPSRTARSGEIFGGIRRKLKNSLSSVWFIAQAPHSCKNRPSLSWTTLVRIIFCPFVEAGIFPICPHPSLSAGRN